MKWPRLAKRKHEKLNGNHSLYQRFSNFTGSQIFLRLQQKLWTLFPERHIIIQNFAYNLRGFLYGFMCPGRVRIPTLYSQLKSLIPLSHAEGLHQGFPTPRPWTGTGPWPVRNRAAQQEVSIGQASEWASEASSVFTATPHRSHYRLSSDSCQISSGIRFSQEREPYCELRMWGI